MGWLYWWWRRLAAATVIWIVIFFVRCTFKPVTYLHACAASFTSHFGIMILSKSFKQCLKKGNNFHQFSRNKANPIFNVVYWQKSGFSQKSREERNTFFNTLHIQSRFCNMGGKRNWLFHFKVSPVPIKNIKTYI